MAASSGPVWHSVPFSQVAFHDRFWAPRQTVNALSTIPSQYEQLAKTGRLDAWRLRWRPGQPNQPHIFWDSDVAKWLEAAAYAQQTHPDPARAKLLTEVVDLIAGAQQPDGYLNTHYLTVEPEKRWTNLRDCHELYCAGHLIEAAVAHFQATGSRKLLDVLVRYADHIGKVFGRGAGQKRGYCGHPEIELALYRLYRATGDRRHLDLCRYFVDERGQGPPHYYDTEAVARGEQPGKFWAGAYDYCQAHQPLREQDQVTGHAVRAMYIYSAMTDLAGELNDAALRTAAERLFHHLVSTRMYVNGGIGSSGRNEGFTADYDLPNETVYAETCAAIGLVFWAHRLLQLTGDGRYADVMERCLYNSTISGVSLSGDRYFYVNPLLIQRSRPGGTPDRQEWFGCACCPPNLARMIAAAGSYWYSTAPATLAVHLYAQGEATLKVDGRAVLVRQTTDYPWDGQVQLALQPAAPQTFTLALRIPGWCRAWTMAVNGTRVTAAPTAGYLRLQREWRPGDVIELTLEMPVERLYAHPRATADWGRVALSRGPLVYCLEGADNGTDLDLVLLPRRNKIEPLRSPLLGGIMVLQGRGRRLTPGPELYATDPPAPGGAVTLTAVPYALWGNRAAGDLVVWMREG